jgi:site-specific DNA-methyltransferase (adenine-specific)
MAKVAKGRESKRERTALSYVKACDAFDLLDSLGPRSVDLFCIDPPYYGIVKDSWDNQWKDPDEYIEWLVELLQLALQKIASDGSLICFGGIGVHGVHPLFDVIHGAETVGWTYRNWITWKKRRAYGKSHDYLFTREEILWYSASPIREEVAFNIPLLDEKRGYAGWNKDYPAKSEYKRVSNVWDDIPELFKPERYTQKPIPLMERLIKTHSNKGDLVVDFFAGWGTTGVAALRNGRRFVGCEAIQADAKAADRRCIEACLLPPAKS